MTVYRKLRNIDKFLNLVARVQNNKLGFDIFCYSNWVHDSFQDGIIDEAFQKVREIVDRKLELDTVCYTILVDGFSKEGYVEKAVGFLYKMRRDGVVSNLVTYTAIILGFCKKGKLEEAFATFAMLDALGIEPDEYTYAILIHGVCGVGDFGFAFQLLGEMEKKGIRPGIVTYNTIVNGLSRAGRTSEADDFSKGIIRDVVTYSTLLHGYVEEHNVSGILKTKSELESAAVDMDIVMCNTLIKALLMVGLLEDARAIYNGLLEMNLSANTVTYHTLIDGYCKLGRIDDALEILDDFQKTSSSSPACYNCVISTLCKKGMIDMAVDVLNEYIKRDLPLYRAMYMTVFKTTFDRNGSEGVLNVIYRMGHLGIKELDIICNNVICFLCKMGFHEASCSVLLFMSRKRLGLTSMCYYYILRALLCEGNKLWARLILTYFVKDFGMSEIRVMKILSYYLCLGDVKRALLYLSTTNKRNWIITIPVIVFETLTNSGRVLDAYELLMGAENNLPGMNVIDYSIMIDTLCKGMYIEKALNVCSLAKKKGIALNIITYNSVINGLCRQGFLVEAFRLFDSLEKIKVFPSEITYGTLIDALVKEGLLVDARNLFERMFLKNLKPTTHSYNSLINGYCKSCFLEEAVKLFQDFEARNLEPDEFTVAALISGYCQKGDMEGSLMLFLEFKSKGFLPDFLGFMYLIRGLCAKGRMEESRGILRQMLQTKSVIDLLSRINTEAESESDSVENLLVFLCDQGRIHEAVTVLDEVGNMFFSADRNSYYRASDFHDSEADTDFKPSICDGIDFLTNVEAEENILKNSDTKDGKSEQFKDFDSFWNLIHSLCLKGELTKANRLTKMVMDL